MSYSIRRQNAARAIAGGLLGLALASCGGGSSPTPTANANDLFDAGYRAQIAGRTQEAIADYQAAIKADPKNKGSYYNLGVIYQAQGKTADAETNYRTALIVDPEYTPALYNLAILRTPTDPWEAVDLYRHLIAINAKDAKSHLNLGYVLKSLGQTDEGQNEINIALGLDPSLAASPSPTP